MKKGDKIVAIVLLIVVMVSFIALGIYRQVSKGSENIAVIKQDGKIIKTIDLNKIVETQEFKIKTEKGDYNTVLVKHNSICIKDSDCPHKECIKSGWISQPGEMIVCLPNKLIIDIQGQNNQIDGATY